MTEEVATRADLPATTGVSQSSNGEWPVYLVDADSVFIQVTDTAKNIVSGLGRLARLLPPSHPEAVSTENLFINFNQIHTMRRASSSANIIRLYYWLEYPTNRFVPP